MNKLLTLTLLSSCTIAVIASDFSPEDRRKLPADVQAGLIEIHGGLDYPIPTDRFYGSPSQAAQQPLTSTTDAELKQEAAQQQTQIDTKNGAAQSRTPALSKFMEEQFAKARLNMLIATSSFRFAEQIALMRGLEKHVETMRQNFSDLASNPASAPCMTMLDSCVSKCEKELEAVEKELPKILADPAANKLFAQFSGLTINPKVVQTIAGHRRRHSEPSILGSSLLAQQQKPADKQA